MLSLELAVDWFKHAFLLKLNFIEVDVFEQYRQVLLADVLVCRMNQNKKNDQIEDELRTTLNTWNTPCRGYYSFAHTCAR